MSPKKQKKVLQIITKSNFGGAQKYVYELSIELKKQAYDVVVVFGGSGLLKEKLEKDKIRTIEIKSLMRDIKLFSDIKALIELVRLIKKEKPDIVHLNSSKIGLIGGLAARICFCPKIIFTIHGLAFNENRNFISKTILKYLYLIIIFMSHYSIAVSNSVKEQILKITGAKILRPKIVVIKNAIRPIHFLDKIEARNFIAKKIEQNIDQKIIIGTIAELHHIKGINYLIDSAKNLIVQNSNLIFVVFGDGEEKNKLQQQIKKNDLENNFFLLGFIDNASTYLKGLDLFVLPSLSEGLALVILEARQAGLKIVASNVGGIPEALENYNDSFLFKVKDIKDLQKKIKKAIVSPKNKINNLESQNFQKMVEKTLEIYFK